MTQSPPGSPAGNEVVIGAAWGVGAAAAHSFVPIAVRLLSHIPAIELVFFRNLIGLTILLAIVSWRGFQFLRTNRLGFHIQRNLANFIGMWLWFAGLAFLPIAKAVALHFTVPLIVVILAVIFLRERPGPVRLVCTLIGFGGVLVILRPGTVPLSPAAFLVLGSALSYAGVAIYTRSLGKTDHATTTTFYYQFMLSIFAGISMLTGWLIASNIPDTGIPLDWFAWVTPTVSDIPGLVLLAISGTVAPYCLVRAFIHAEATIVEPIEYLRLPITALVAYLVFDQTTDIWVWIGAAVIAGSTYYMTRHEAKASAHH
ncbi:MAG: EamA family transporter [Alphaproteobacteria bacterium]|nr:EamA family transporter [Alphaproteobacteria bacterium]